MILEKSHCDWSEIAAREKTTIGSTHRLPPQKRSLSRIFTQGQGEVNKSHSFAGICSESVGVARSARTHLWQPLAWESGQAVQGQEPGWHFPH
jgi:hypothetical protein